MQSTIPPTIEKWCAKMDNIIANAQPPVGQTEKMYRQRAAIDAEFGFNLAQQVIKLANELKGKEIKKTDVFRIQQLAREAWIHYSCANYCCSELTKAELYDFPTIRYKDFALECAEMARFAAREIEAKYNSGL
jgi:hypothetical protein